MPKLLTTLPFIAALAFGSPVWAQDTSSTTTEQPAAEQPAADQPTTDQTATDTQTKPATMDDGLSMGNEGQQPKQPEAYTKAEYGNWKLQCFKVEEGDEPCQLYQLLKDDQGTDVAEVALFRLAGSGKAVAGATVTVPLETLLTAQLTVAVDGAKGKRYPFSFCAPVGCYARIGFTEQDIAAFKKGASATITLRPAPAPDQEVTLKMSLDGFTAGYDATSAIKN
ncbi:invasion associated locus B family protein [Aquicoccus sp. G2-2]|uniref:invasion associated locus B family protein n=1 Tax=Aquicoccus sp. G2-2 TaxID=3092120 RepID=UPI002AE0B033|nr:invasion associated locus B family protein [Aquicoccus sp. G2-2]MEA1113122.1 invasion associated locus B family protein [Aquicoccus sp. G2-2]